MSLPPGPMRSPNSVRGRREAKWAAAAGSDAPVTLTLPNTSLSQAEIWQDICDQLAAASVPLKQVDAYAIELAAGSVHAVGEAEKLGRAEDAEPEIRLRAMQTARLLRQDAMRYLMAICATPAARIRIVKPTNPKRVNAAVDAVADLLS